MKAGAHPLAGVQTTILYWSMFEIGLSIIAACLPTLWPLLTQRPPLKVTSSLRDLVAPFRSRPSPRNLSQITLPPKPPSEEDLGLQSVVTRSLHRPSGEVGGKIMVTTGLEMRESVPKVPRNMV